MNEDNLPRAFKKLVSFAIFTIGALTTIFGGWLIIDSFLYNNPYKLEGGMIMLLGVICMYLADQSILNTKRNDMLKEMIKENQTLARQQRGGGGILNSLLGGMGFMGGTMGKIKIISGSPEDFEKELSDFGRNPIQTDFSSDPSFQKDVKDLMKKTNLSEEDAAVAIRLQSMSDEQCEQAMAEAKETDRFELAAHIQKMLESRKSS